MMPEDDPSKSKGAQYATGEEQRATTNSSRKKEAAGPKWETMLSYGCVCWWK